jgi:hypothetical protein
MRTAPGGAPPDQLANGSASGLPARPAAAAPHHALSASRARREPQRPVGSSTTGRRAEPGRHARGERSTRSTSSPADDEDIGAEGRGGTGRGAGATDGGIMLPPASSRGGGAVAVAGVAMAAAATGTRAARSSRSIAAVRTSHVAMRVVVALVTLSSRSSRRPKGRPPTVTLRVAPTPTTRVPGPARRAIVAGRADGVCRASASPASSQQRPARSPPATLF